MEVVELSSLSWALWKRALRPVCWVKRWASLRRTKSSKVGGVSLLTAQRCLNRCHRTLTGASTLMKRKNGLRSRASTTLSSQMSVVTQRSLHLRVTNSSKPSISAKVCSVVEEAVGDGTCASEADFSTAGVAAVRARRRRLKPCSSIRYEAIEDFPAHMPVTSQLLYCIRSEVLASAYPNKHGDELNTKTYYNNISIALGGCPQ